MLQTMLDAVERYAHYYSFHTTLGVWLIVLSFIGTMVLLGLSLRVLFPIKPSMVLEQTTDSGNLVFKEA